MKDNYILAVETTCDETSIAIVKNGKEVLVNTVLSQIDLHTKYGGVIPELASRKHTENITLVLEDTLNNVDITLEDIDAIAVAYAPGLLGSLLVGVEFAKSLSYLLNTPLIKVNHLIGHIYASKIEHNLNFPLLALVVSGGHTEVVVMEEDYKFTKLGQTLDDAIGESYDKVARVLNIPYPGGPGVEKAALDGSNIYQFPVPNLDNPYDFSYSGLKTSVINLVNNKKQRNELIDVSNIANSFQYYAALQITNVLKRVIEDTKITNIIVAGGVSANKYLNKEIKSLFDTYNGNVYTPSIEYCTDNAAMIAMAAYPLYLKEEFTTLALTAKSTSDIT